MGCPLFFFFSLCTWRGWAQGRGNFPSLRLLCVCERGRGRGLSTPWGTCLHLSAAALSSRPRRGGEGGGERSMSLTRVLETSFALSIVLWSVVGGGWGVLYIYIYSVHPSPSLPPSLPLSWVEGGEEGEREETGGDRGRGCLCMPVHVCMCILSLPDEMTGEGGRGVPHPHTHTLHSGRHRVTCPCVSVCVHVCVCVCVTEEEEGGTHGPPPCACACMYVCMYVCFTQDTTTLQLPCQMPAEGGRSRASRQDLW